ncbi:phosphodiester glycosidase family protein [Candidatus Roizmanbacteria bacterium]|nr:phosphodiester glycosidase family protein [Candidatus Roizmanbacteria bacterium]
MLYSILICINKILKHPKFLLLCGVIFVLATSIAVTLSINLKNQVDSLANEKNEVSTRLTNIKSELDVLKKEDQYVKNKNLEETISKIEKTYTQAVDAYEKLLDLKNISKKTDTFDNQFAEILTLLSERNYSSAEGELKDLTAKIQQEQQKIASSFVIPTNLPSSNSPPSSGYSRQAVQTDAGSFMVDIVSADLNSTRVSVDTASESDCSNDCPVLSLGDYVGRNGAYAGINGSYFCPADYPSCSDKKNTFDFLLMNKNKKYFNSDKNVYSTIPAAIFLGGSVRFVGQSLEWGRDTSPDGVIGNYPLLTIGGNVVFGGSGEAKLNSKGSRSFVGATGSTVYIGVVYNATVMESAKTLQALGIQNSLNLDDGGSTALWFGAYKAGPGRALPNAILFVRK